MWFWPSCLWVRAYGSKGNHFQPASLAGPSFQQPKICFKNALITDFHSVIWLTWKLHVSHRIHVHFFLWQSLQESSQILVKILRMNTPKFDKNPNSDLFCCMADIWKLNVLQRTPCQLWESLQDSIEIPVKILAMNSLQFWEEKGHHDVVPFCCMAKMKVGCLSYSGIPHVVLHEGSSRVEQGSIAHYFLLKIAAFRATRINTIIQVKTQKYCIIMKSFCDWKEFPLSILLKED